MWRFQILSQFCSRSARIAAKFLHSKIEIKLFSMMPHNIAAYMIASVVGAIILVASRVNRLQKIHMVRKGGVSNTYLHYVLILIPA